jgi:hypothetical protein
MWGNAENLKPETLKSADPELKHLLYLGRRLNSWLDYEAWIMAQASTNPEAVRRAADRLREGMMAVLRQTLDELVPPKSDKTPELVVEGGAAAA